ncbi:hypothetical protein Gotur_032033 [Gossypium turneri]
MSNAWNQTRWMKRLAVSPITTPEYIEWWGRRINDNILGLSQGDNQPTGKHLRVFPSELEIIRRDFERKNSKLEKKMEQMKEEKMNLRLDMDVQKLETKKLRKRKNKADGDLDSLKTNYKKLRFSMKTEARMQNETLEKSLSESQNEKGELKARVAELEKTLHQYRNCNSAMELRPVKSVRKNSSTLVRTKLETDITLWETFWLRFERRIDKGKGPMTNLGEDNEEPLYPLGFTPPIIQAQVEMYSRRPSVTIRPQQSQVDASMPINF